MEDMSDMLERREELALHAAHSQCACESCTVYNTGHV